MRARPFLLVGASSLAAVRGRLEAAMASWRSDWGFDGLEMEVSCARAWESTSLAGLHPAVHPAVHPDMHLRQRFFESAAGSMRLTWRPEAAKVLQRAMFPTFPAFPRFPALPTFPADLRHAAGRGEAAIADAAGEQALASLVERIGGLLSAEPTASPDGGAWVAQALVHGSGAVLASIGFMEQKLSCLMDPAAVGALPAASAASAASAAPAAPAASAAQPAPPTGGLGKANLARALGGVSVSLPVIVGEAEVDLANLASLAVGDVIRLDAPIEKPLAVRTADGESLFEVFLGRIGRDVAVEVVGRGKSTL
jgi:flagellar motor switch/type III secretory pathway protein FliN